MLESILSGILIYEARHNALKIKGFDNLSLRERMEFIKLKVNLGKAHSEATALLPVDQREARGKHLRAAVQYHPSLLPELAGRADVLVAPEKKLGEVLEFALVIGIVVPVVAVAAPLSAAWGLANFITFDAVEIVSTRSYNAIKNAIHAPDVQASCLQEIDSTISADACLSIAVAYLSEKKNYLAIRYILEAEMRATEKNIEILHYFFKCLNNVRGAAEYEYFNATDNQFFQSTLYAIKNRVLSGKAAPQDSQLDFIWKITDPDLTHNHQKLYLDMPSSPWNQNTFYRKIWGELFPPGVVDPDYGLTVAELAYCLSEKLLSEYPQIAENYCFSRRKCYSFYRSENALLKKLSLAELLALMTQVCSVPREILDLGLKNLSLTNKEEQAFLRECLLEAAPAEPVSAPWVVNLQRRLGAAPSDENEIEMTELNGLSKKPA